MNLQYVLPRYTQHFLSETAASGKLRSVIQQLPSQGLPRQLLFLPVRQPVHLTSFRKEFQKTSPTKNSSHTLYGKINSFTRYP